MNYVFDNQEISVFVQPFYSNTINILRAPYKNKISKHQVTLSRYVVITKIMFFDNLGKNYTSIPSVCHQINFLKNQLSFFESNVAFQHKSTVKLNLILNGYFNADFFLKQT